MISLIIFKYSHQDGKFRTYLSKSLSWKNFVKDPNSLLLLIGVLTSLSILPLWGFHIWGMTDANVLIAIFTMLLFYYCLRYISRLSGDSKESEE
jgi:hypothetical protein